MLDYSGNIRSAPIRFFNINSNLSMYIHCSLGWILIGRKAETLHSVFTIPFVPAPHRVHSIHIGLPNNNGLVLDHQNADQAKADFSGTIDASAIHRIYFNESEE
jgi:hypothetical protein